MASLPPFSSVVPRHRARVRSPEFHHFPVLTWTFLRYSPGPFSDTHPDFTRFRYLPGTFSGTRPDPSLVLVWILPVFGTRPELFRYSPGPFSGTRLELFRYLPEPFFGTYPEPSLVLARTLFRYSPEFYPFSVLARIPPFFGTRSDPSPVLTQIRSPVYLVFSGTRKDTILSILDSPVLVWI